MSGFDLLNLRLFDLSVSVVELVCFLQVKFVTRRFIMDNFEDILKCLAYVKECCFRVLHYHQRRTFERRTFEVPECDDFEQ